MSKAHRGGPLKKEGMSRGTCPITGRTGVKLLYEHVNKKGEKIKISKEAHGKFMNMKKAEEKKRKAAEAKIVAETPKQVKVATPSEPVAQETQSEPVAQETQSEPVAQETQSELIESPPQEQSKEETLTGDQISESALKDTETVDTDSPSSSEAPVSEA